MNRKRLVKIIALVSVIGLFCPALLRFGDWVTHGNQPFTIIVEADNGEKQEQQDDAESQSDVQDNDTEKTTSDENKLVEVVSDPDLDKTQIAVTVVKGALNFKEITVHSTGVKGAAGFEVEGFTKPIGKPLTLMLAQDKVELTLVNPQGESLAEYVLDFTKDYNKTVVESKK